MNILAPLVELSWLRNVMSGQMQLRHEQQPQGFGSHARTVLLLVIQVGMGLALVIKAVSLLSSR